MKIKDILESPYLNEKKLALKQVLNLSIPELLLKKDQVLTKEEEKKYQKIAQKINQGLPIQYILKNTYFYGEKFYINKNVLIPRPETEYLVEETLKLIEKYYQNKKISILDIGTGSGVIAITLNKKLKNSTIIATDISKKALKVAKINQKLHKTNIKLKQTNLYQNINKKFDIVISNPPYIEKNSSKVENKVKNYEPSLALYGKEDGLYYYKEILKNITKILKEKHILAFEIGENQGEKIKTLIKKELSNDKVIIKKDYNGYDRYIYSINQ